MERTNRRALFLSDSDLRIKSEPVNIIHSVPATLCILDFTSYPIAIGSHGTRPRSNGMTLPPLCHPLVEGGEACSILGCLHTNDINGERKNLHPTCCGPCQNTPRRMFDETRISSMLTSSGYEQWHRIHLNHAERTLPQ